MIEKPNQVCQVQYQLVKKLRDNRVRLGYDVAFSVEELMSRSFDDAVSCLLGVCRVKLDVRKIAASFDIEKWNPHDRWYSDSNMKFVLKVVDCYAFFWYALIIKFGPTDVDISSKTVDLSESDVIAESSRKQGVRTRRWPGFCVVGGVRIKCLFELFMLFEKHEGETSEVTRQRCLMPYLRVCLSIRHEGRTPPRRMRKGNKRKTLFRETCNNAGSRIAGFWNRKIRPLRHHYLHVIQNHGSLLESSLSLSRYDMTEEGIQTGDPMVVQSPVLLESSTDCGFPPIPTEFDDSMMFPPYGGGGDLGLGDDCDEMPLSERVDLNAADDRPDEVPSAGYGTSYTMAPSGRPEEESWIAGREQECSTRISPWFDIYSW